MRLPALANGHVIAFAPARIALGPASASSTRVMMYRSGLSCRADSVMNTFTALDGVATASPRARSIPASRKTSVAAAIADDVQKAGGWTVKQRGLRGC